MGSLPRIRSPLGAAPEPFLALPRLRSPVTPLAKGLSVVYPLDEASGVRRERRRRGLSPSGQFTAASSQYLSIADNAALSAGGVSLAWLAWVYLDSKPLSGTILGKGTGGGFQNAAYQFRYESGVDRFRIRVGNGSVAVSQLSNLHGSPSLATWYAVWAWLDVVAGTLNIQVDEGPVDSLVTANVSFDEANEFRLGRDVGGNFNHWDGRLGPVALWKGGFPDAATRSRLYHHGRGLAYEQLPASALVNLVGWWIGGREATTWTDLHGSNHLTNNNGVLWAPGVTDALHAVDVNTVTATAGWATFTAANGEQLLVPDNARVRGGDSDWTLAGDVYLETTTGDMVILAKDTGGAGGREYRLEYDNGDDRLRWTVYDGTDAIGTVDADELGAPADDTFYRVRVWHSATDNEVGIQVDDGTPDVAATTGAAATTTSPLHFGADGSGSPAYLNGRMKDWHRWGRLLTAGEAASVGDGAVWPFEG